MSNHNMNRFRRLRRTAIAAVTVCVALLFLSAAAVRIRQQVLRYRAERLLSDFRDLKLRTSTWSDAQNIFRRWGSWGHYDGTCTREACTYWIELSDDFSNFVQHRRLPGWKFMSVFEFLGGRPTLIRASLTVADGLVWEKSFLAVVSVPPQRGPDKSFAGSRYNLIGGSGSVSRFSSAPPELAVHENYLVSTPGGGTGCRAVGAKFTPYADSADVQRLMNFDLSCITRRRPCWEPGEIMPDAWKQYEAEHQDPFIPSKRFNACNFSLRLLGRDIENAAVVEAVSRMAERSGAGTPMFQLRMVQRLKGSAFWDLNAIRAVLLADEGAGGGCVLPATSPGSRFILLFRGWKFERGPEDREIPIHARTRIALTPQNLAEIQVGIRQDFLSKD